MKKQACCVQTRACRINLLSEQEEKENKGAAARKTRKGRIANQEQRFIILRWFSKATSTSVTASAAVKQAFAAVTVMNGSPCVYWNMVDFTSCLISLSNLYFTHSSATFKSSAWLPSCNLWLQVQVRVMCWLFPGVQAAWQQSKSRFTVRLFLNSVFSENWKSKTKEFFF